MTLPHEFDKLPLSNDCITNLTCTQSIYEPYIFRRLFIASFWFVVALFVLGFEIDGFNRYQDLLANFGALLLIIGLMLGSLQLHFILFEQPKTEKLFDELENAITTHLNEQEQKIVCEFLENNGYLSPNYQMRWALVGFYVIFLVELFLVSAFIREGYIVWQPTWILVIINWVENHTTWVAVVNGGGFFDFNAMMNKDDWVYQLAKTPQEFVSSELGKASMLLSLFQVLVYLPKILLALKTFGFPLTPSNTQIVKDYNDNNKKARGVIWGFIWHTAMMLATFLFFFGGLLMCLGLNDDDKIFLLLDGKYYWLDFYYMPVCIYFFSCVFYVLFMAWLYKIYLGFLAVYHWIVNRE